MGPEYARIQKTKQLRTMMFSVVSASKMRARFVLRQSVRASHQRRF